MNSTAKQQKQTLKISPKIKYLKDLTPKQKSGSSIKVKAIRVWKTHYLGAKSEEINKDSIIPGEPLLNYNINMILMDEQGTKIHACANFYTIYKPSWEKPLKEGAQLILTNFKCVANKASIMLTDHPTKLYFTNRTTVTLTDEFNSQADGFKFLLYENITNNKVTTQVAFDIIGQIVSNNKVRQVKLHDKTTSLIEYELQNTSGHKIKCVLWGDDAETLQDYINHHVTKNKPIVIIIQLAKLTIWENKHQVSNINKASKIYINTDNNRINSFKDRLAANLANGTCKQVQLQLTTTINRQTGTNNTKVGTKREWEKIHPNTNPIIKIDDNKDNRETKRKQNVKKMGFNNVIDIDDCEQQQNWDPTTKTRTTIQISDDEDT